MNEIAENIETMIYEIREKQVMLDRDLAKLYRVETKVFMQSVKRNIKRFPIEFMFQLTYEEFLDWRSQIVTSKNDAQGLRRPPYAFTEQGVAMLSSVLKSKIAIETSIKIMDAFVSMRHYLNENKDIYKSLNTINNKLVEHDEKFDLIFSSFKDKNNYLFLNGEKYDSYSLMIDIFNRSKEEIIVIDNYVDKNLLDILSKTNKTIKVVTNKYNRYDYSKYIEQYHNVELIINNNFHDRFIIIDKKELYHCGASFKDLGVKCFVINRIDDEDCLNKLINKI